MWTDLYAWFQTPAGGRVLQTAIVPAAAILVAGVVAALIGRAAIRSVLTAADRERAATAIGALVEAARAAAEAEETRGGRRRAARLRTEADVRLRLLPVKGAAVAADWASARIESVSQEQDPAAGIADLRDRLIAWAKRPSRARRVFADPPRRPAQKAAHDEGARAVEAAEAAAPERPATPTASAPEPVPPTAADPSDARGDAVAVPAWQRTRSGGRLQQEHAPGRRDEDPTGDDPADQEADEHRPATAPVRTHAHRAGDDPLDRDESAGRERTPTADEDGPTGPSDDGEDRRRPPEPSSARPTPAWLDTYDDDAEVTQNLDLRTPPPVAASAVRDRGPRGEDLVPRS